MNILFLLPRLPLFANCRGHGYVNISFTDAAVDMLHLPDSYRPGHNVTIMYWQVRGPELS